MNIIKIAEKDIENGRVKKAEDVFKRLSTINRKSVENATVNVLSVIDSRMNLQDLLVKKLIK